MLINYEHNFRMLVVNRSYRELTGFQPVELTDNSFSYRENYRLLTPANFRQRSRLTPVNSRKRSLRNLNKQENSR